MMMMMMMMMMIIMSVITRGAVLLLPKSKPYIARGWGSALSQVHRHFSSSCVLGGHRSQ